MKGDFCAMFRIGIIGSDNSHALAFSRLANLPDENGAFLFPDVRVTAIYGTEPGRTKEVAQGGQIGTVVDKPEDMTSLVDAVMVVFRHGGLHYRYALPFVEAGIPTWVDKPFTIDLSETDALIRAAEKRGTLLAGGSTCKYCPDVLALKSDFDELSRDGRVISAGFNFPGELDSPYGGIYFYGGHSMEILTTIFGPDVRSIRTDVHCGSLIAIMKYDSFTVTINFSEVSEFYGTIYSAERVAVRKIDISTVYRHGFEKFVEALRKNCMTEKTESLRRPVVILNALDRAVKCGEEVRVGL